MIELFHVQLQHNEFGWCDLTERPILGKEAAQGHIEYILVHTESYLLQKNFPRERLRLRGVTAKDFLKYLTDKEKEEMLVEHIEGRGLLEELASRVLGKE